MKPILKICPVKTNFATKCAIIFIQQPAYEHVACEENTRQSEKGFGNPNNDVS